MREPPWMTPVDLNPMTSREKGRGRFGTERRGDAEAKASQRWRQRSGHAATGTRSC